MHREMRLPLALSRAHPVAPDLSHAQGGRRGAREKAGFTFKMYSIIEMASAKRSILSRSGKSRPSIGPQEIIQMRSVKHESARKTK
jgi:hypothetical protein